MTARTRMHWTDADAREAIAKYEGMVRQQARRFVGIASGSHVLDMDDLCAAGRVAVLEAMETYRGFGVSEQSWVRTRIRTRLIDTIRSCDIRTRGETRRMLAARDTGAGASETATRLASARRLLSLDTHPQPEAFVAEHGLTPGGTCAPDELAVEAQRRRRLLRALATLPRRQRQAMSLTLLEGLRPARVSRRMGVCESRVTQLQRRGVERIRTAIQDPRCWSVPPGAGDELSGRPR